MASRGQPPGEAGVTVPDLEPVADGAQVREGALAPERRREASRRQPSAAQTVPDLDPVGEEAHLREEQLAALATGQLLEPERRQLSAHLEGCAECRGELADLRRGTELLDPLLGSVVAGYRVERFLSHGGMGAVYLASGLDGAQVALKVLLSSVAEDPQFQARMRGEARALMAVRHRNVVGVRGVGELPDGRPWLMMDFIAGQTLAERLTLQGFNLRGASTLLDQLLAGLEACHALGVLHRDLKPSNLLVRDTPGGPEVVLIDFGLAKARNATAITHADALVGSVGYLAPELLRGEPVSLPADLYAVGCIAWRLFTGESVYAPGPVVETMQRHLADPVPRLRAVVPEAPGLLAQWVERLLSKDPAARYASAKEAREALAVARRALEHTVLDEDDEPERTDPMVPTAGGSGEWSQGKSTPGSEE